LGHIQDPNYSTDLTVRLGAVKLLEETQGVL
jgi:hypothetical protein